MASHALSRRRWLAQAAAAQAAVFGLGWPSVGGVRAAGRSVVDMAGRRVELPERIERIASAGGSPAVNAFLFLFGMGSRLVTGLPAAFQGPAWRFQRVFAPEIDGKPVVSGPPPAWTPNVEALMALHPDLSFVVSEAAADLVQRAGLPALMLQWDRVDSIARTVTLLGEVFRQQAKAEAYFAWKAGLEQRLAERIGTPKRRPRVLYMRHSTLTQPIMVPANHLIAQAGGESVTARDNPMGLDVFPFSVEQVLAWQPEVILLAFGEEAEAVAADPRLATVPAVKQRRIHRVPHGAHIWTHYTPEQPLGVLWLASLLHPGRFSEAEVRGETAGFYTRFFGRSLDTADLTALLKS